MLKIIKGHVSYNKLTRIIKEAVTDIHNDSGNSLVNLLKKTYLVLKDYNGDNEKDITTMILYLAKKIKPESIGYIERFKHSGRKILLIKNLEEKNFCFFTEDDNENYEHIGVNYYELPEEDDFKHELVHLINYIEMIAKYPLGSDVRKFKHLRIDKNKYNYPTNPDELEKNLSMYISNLKSKKINQVQNCEKVLKEIFKEYLETYGENKFQILLNKSNLKNKILKRLYREGIRFKS